jgi:hypothetical protein
VDVGAAVGGSAIFFHSAIISLTVTLDEKIDFTGAHVEHLITKNITKKAGLYLILTNTNVKF